VRRVLGALVATTLSATLIAPHSAQAVNSTSAPIGTEVTISTSGDILAHSSLFNKAKTKSGYDFNPLLANLKPLLTADINICHLETPLSSKKPTGFPLFHTPVQLAVAIKNAGFQGCSTVSNHSLDAGLDGVFTTKRTMLATGLKTAGTRLSKNDSAVAWYTTDKGVRVAQLAYAFGFNGIPRPKGKEWAVNLIDAKNILAAAKTAREAGAQLVIVSLHWGIEYSDTPSAAQKDLAKKLTASPYIDGIIGHHTHVIQYAAVVNGKPVIYGTGNLWSAQGPWAGMKNGQHGAIVTLKFRVAAHHSDYVSGSFVPTFVPRYIWKVGAAKQVTLSAQKTEACRAIQNAAKHLSKVLSGPTKC
jgi:poly-gamma-glutamate capsule biosynthesis protein CapA/YwtB (metallophosphatase superfamily)